MESKTFCLFVVDIIYMKNSYFSSDSKEKNSFCKYCTYILANTSIDGKSINKDHGFIAYSMKNQRLQWTLQKFKEYLHKNMFKQVSSLHF